MYRCVSADSRPCLKGPLYPRTRWEVLWINCVPRPYLLYLIEKTLPLKNEAASTLAADAKQIDAVFLLLSPLRVCSPVDKL